MTKISELIESLDTLAPFSLQESYDNAQLLTGSRDWEVTGVLCTLDAIEATIDEAVEKSCNVVLAHHPIIFSGLKKLTGSNYIERTIIKAIKQDIAILPVHTNLDSVHPGGVNSRLAEILELQDCEVMMPKEEMDGRPFTTGMGLIGHLSNDMAVDYFFHYLAEKLELKSFKHTPVIQNTIRRVAICGGSGSFLLDRAAQLSADVFITSDFKYHQFFDADNRLIVCDIGHYESEKHTIKLLSRYIQDNFSNFAAHCTDLNTNPIEYFINYGTGNN